MQQRRRSIGEYGGLVARGFAMGAADVVPGVSGGTMAFILGIYEELIDSIRSVARREFLTALRRGRMVEAFDAINGRFLLSVGGGIILAILTLARTLEYLLENKPVLIWSFFFGLVLASVFSVARRITRWNGPLLLVLLAGTVGAWLLVGLVPVETPTTWWFLFLSGAVAICAMILPGISGAFILLLLGKYEYILSAVNDRNPVPILWVASGAAVGIVTFAQVLGWLFRRYHDLTVAALTGLMLGSLRKVWPWKADVAAAGHDGSAMLQKNVWPPLGEGSGVTEFLLALALAMIAFVAVLLLDRWAERSGHPEMVPGS